MEKSYYGIDRTYLMSAARFLQVGEGIQQRISTDEAMQRLREAERWAESQISEWLAVPLKPTRLRGVGDLPATLSDYLPEHFPIEFIDAVVFRAVYYIALSEYSQADPNLSAFVDKAELEANTRMMLFRSKRNVNVGAGRRLNPNPFVPPTIARHEDTQNQLGGK